MARASFRLTPEQALAADPTAPVWVSASAGSGKTQVLTARVLRLLLQDVRPEAILCITFTKAAAAEMATRVFKVLGDWARASDEQLRAEFAGLGETPTPERLARARTLFARCLDAEGGLKIQTLHAFAQSLLANFPLEAGIAPGFSTLDDRTAAEAIRTVMTAELSRAARQGDHRLLEDVACISVAAGDQKFMSIVNELIRQGPRILAFAGQGGRSGIEPRLRALFSLPRDGTATDWLAGQLTDDRLQWLELPRLAEAWTHGAAGDKDKAARLQLWLAREAYDRADAFSLLRGLFISESSGKPYARLATNGAKKFDPGIEEVAEQALARVTELQDTVARFHAVDTAACYLRFGFMLAAAMEAYKARVGALGFDDLIARAARLLTAEGAAQWVRYKLDMSIDHVLVDEAQDTNADQWAIVRALTEEFFAGLGTHEPGRTVFAVGDIKQAIFGFQGSDPATFIEAEKRYAEEAEAVGAELRRVPLDRSFRSTEAVLRLVDAAINQLGPQALGIAEAHPHVASRAGQTGMVALWPAIEPLEAEEEDEGSPGAAGEMGWQPPAERRLAEKIARQIADWLQRGEQLEARSRPLRPGDILVLVRKRSEFVRALVAELAHLGVPVAGVDRMMLAVPLAVRDILSLIRFALLPDDDLTLAEVLKSPFIGWDEDQLFDLAHGRGEASLWTALKHKAEEGYAEAAQANLLLHEVLAVADWAPPFEFLEIVLSDLGGRNRALARFGPQARDPLDMLMEAALAYEQDFPPSLQGFLDWLERGDIEVKRDPEAARDEVRVMTVHGAKGLQAPIVILADAYALPDDKNPMVPVRAQESTVPIWYGGKSYAVGPVSQSIEQIRERQAQEHARLLYVALTRAEDRLYVAGWKPRRNISRSLTPWYETVASALDELEAQTIDDPLWGEVRRFRLEGPNIHLDRPGEGDVAPALEMPAWARAPAGAEPRPPRPLAPSHIATVAEPPAGSPLEASTLAARRGTLIHRLCERLPVTPEDAREEVARRWLDRCAADLSWEAREEIITTVLRTLHDPEISDLFEPDALAEVPLSAVIEGRVFSGQVDRLIVKDGTVLVVDIKTGAQVPASAAETPLAYLQQMGAYRAALALMFPDKAIEAALLWTSGPTLMTLPAHLMEQAFDAIGS